MESHTSARPPLPTVSPQMKADLINPVITATTAVFSQRLAVQLTRGEPYLRRSAQNRQPIVGLLGLTGDCRAAVLLDLDEAVAARIAISLRKSGALPPSATTADGVCSMLQSIAERLDGDCQASLPVVVQGSGTAIGFPAGFVPLCVPFTSPWGLVTLEVVLVEQPPDEDPFERASEFLEQIQELTTAVAQGVGDHNAKVSQINEELKSCDAATEEAVLAAVSRLIEANEHMHRELTVAEDELLAHARAIEAHVAEARTDVLTGLVNRRALYQALRRLTAQHHKNGTPVSLMLVDVDHFKRLNDACGHGMGDAVLKDVAATLRGSVRRTDLVARHGGDEFTIVFPDTALEEASSIAERARQAVRQCTVEFEGAPLTISASGGLAEVTSGEEGPQLVSRADVALYAAKRAGRNCQFWHDGKHPRPMRQQVVDSAVVESAVDMLPVFNEATTSP
jgi:diguanylate cyclase (GGDEF)-like protein